jgi:hypothetical protein
LSCKGPSNSVAPDSVLRLPRPLLFAALNVAREPKVPPFDREFEIGFEESDEGEVGIPNSGKNTDEEQCPTAPFEDEGEDAEASIRGAFRTLVATCWANERFKDREAEGEGGVPLDGSNCMRRQRLCRKTKARSRDEDF